MKEINKMILKTQVEDVLMHDMRFKHPIINYILYKEENPIVCFTDGIQTFIYNLYSDVLIKEENINYDNEVEQSLYEACAECYLLLKLRENYNIIYISIQFHSSIWNFIAYYNEEIMYVKQTVIEYLKYCKETGINLLNMREYAIEPEINLYIVFNLVNDIDDFSTALKEMNYGIFVEIMRANTDLIENYFNKYRILLGGNENE